MFRKLLTDSVNILWAVIYCTVLFCLYVFGGNSIIYTLPISLFLILFCFIRKTKEDRRKIRFLCLGFFVFQIFLALNIYFRAGWDVLTLTTGAYSDVLDPPPPYALIHAYDYLNMYPNNMLIYGYYTLMARICLALHRGPNFYYATMILVNIIIYTFTSFCLYESVRKLTGDVYAEAAWFIYAVIIGTSAWYLVPYSDSLTLLFPSLCLYIYLFMRSGFKYPLISFLIAVAFYIKPQSGIFMIALVIISVIHVSGWKSLKESLLPVILSVLCFLAVAVPVEHVKSSYFEPDKALGFTHFAMMGLNVRTNGGYAIEDVEYSQQFTTSEERTKGEIERIRERMESIDLSEHFRNKLLFNYNDGNFYFGQEGGFYSFVFRDLFVFSAFLKDVFLDTGKYYSVIKTVRHLLYVAVLFLSLFSFKDRRKEVLLIKLSLTGLFMFQMLFEARSRYLFIYVPFLIILACIGMRDIGTAYKTMNGRQEL